MSHKMSAIDVTTDVEFTTTKWSEKEDWTEWTLTNRNMSILITI
jgi:hypothetical protein